jgi:hypothetical protein
MKLSLAILSVASLCLFQSTDAAVTKKNITLLAAPNLLYYLIVRMPLFTPHTRFKVSVISTMVKILLLLSLLPLLLKKVALYPYVMELPLLYLKELLAVVYAIKEPYFRFKRQVKLQVLLVPFNYPTM